MFEWHATGEVRGHHDHAGHPEEDDVVACDKDAGRQIQVYVFELSGLIGRVVLGRVVLGRV